MSISSQICKKCQKKVSKAEKLIHELVCNSSQNNIHKGDNLFFNICEKINYGNRLQYNLQDIFNKENSYVDNFYQKDEEALSMDGILNSRNIQSNYSFHYDNNELQYNYRENVFESYSISSFNKSIANDIINNLVSNKINDVNKISNDNCIICLENYKIGDSYITLPCIHNFHDECIKKWLSLKNKCPICFSKIRINNMIL